ncbi:unnamed protein product [Protopolystoma xenopodis]|uniref:Uncharacterized protein n=1 Tax=Protopolystoma xenopodis TaxID=117903 RepID=A0A3S5B030_9PLAT|nr:unnamed protein product [Protopolystoma xenopodis]
MLFCSDDVRHMRDENSARIHRGRREQFFHFPDDVIISRLFALDTGEDHALLSTAVSNFSANYSGANRKGSSITQPPADWHQSLALATQTACLHELFIRHGLDFTLRREDSAVLTVHEKLQHTSTKAGINQIW